MKKLMIWVFLSIFVSDIAHSEEFQIISENFSPFNYVENGENKGFSVEILQAVLKEMRVDIPVVFYPWARAYKMAQKEPNTLIFSLARNPERENLFKWAGEIVTFDSSLYKLRSRKDIQIQSLEDVKKYSVGAVNKSAPANYLISLGFNPELVTNYSQNMMKLKYGRIDVIPYNKFSLTYEAPLAGYDPEDFEPTITLNKISLYFAFSRQTPDALVTRFHEALVRVKSDRTYNAVMHKYLGNAR